MDSNILNSLKLSQLFWLIKDLKENKQPFTIVYFHHPPYSSGNHGSKYYLRFIWGFIFEYFNTDIVFNGHDHCYERGKVKSVNYIITGGGGAPPYDVGNNWWTIYSEKTFHYCLISCNQYELSYKAIKPDGTLFDSFNIYK
ncbi:MAG: metallophosphoesterase [Thermoplasmatales archaeon]|nr:MAG: metallophosphoesterase [Thermoplasmatales archaeon]